MKIKMIGIMHPRDRFPYFSNNPELWLRLKEGKVIEIPDELFPELTGVEAVEYVKTTGEEEPFFKKGKKNKRGVIEDNVHEVTSFDNEHKSTNEHCKNC